MLARSKILAAGAAVAALGVLGGAAALADGEFIGNAATGAGTCFLVRDVEGYSPADLGARDGVNLIVKGKQVYQLEFAGSCPGAGDSLRIRLQSRQTSGFICSGSDAHLVTFSRIAAPEQCLVSGLRKLTDAQIAALPAEQRP